MTIVDCDNLAPGINVPSQCRPVRVFTDGTVQPPAVTVVSGDLVVGGGVTVGAVELTGTEGAPDILVVGGAINTFHDFVLIPAAHMMAGAGVTQAFDAATARRRMSKGETVAWAREIPAGWGQISLNLLFTKEIAGTGNVHWSLDIRLVDFLTGEQLDGASTTFDIGGVSVPAAVLESKYYIPSTTQAIDTPPQPFGLPPLLSAILTRVDDATDTYAGDAGLVAMSMSRT